MCSSDLPYLPGWDCHGLPIEHQVEKKKGKVGPKLTAREFRDHCREYALRQVEEQKEDFIRLGVPGEWDNPYLTLDKRYEAEQIRAFAEIYANNHVTYGHKPVHWCLDCQSALAEAEVEYMDKVSTSVDVLFKIVDPSEFIERTNASKINNEKELFIPIWTTTPWTLMGNVALAVGEDIEYVKAKKEDGIYIVAKDLAERVLKEDYEIVSEIRGKELVGKKYKPVFDYYSKDFNLENHENGWKVYAGDFVTIEDGTGIVHVASAFGEDDLNLGRKHKLPFIQHVNIDGTIKKEVTELAGRQAKPKSTDEEPKKHQETDIEVLKLLAHKGLLFAKEKYTHSYPHCWRTDAPLLNYSMSSWFIKVTDVKDKLVSENKKVNWVPEDIKEGRFGKWLEGEIGRAHV